jgi:hypothetical protein
MFFVEHGFMSPAAFSGVCASFEDVPWTMKAAEDIQAAGPQRNVARGPNIDQATKLPRLRRAHSLMPLVTAVLANKELMGSHSESLILTVPLKLILLTSLPPLAILPISATMLSISPKYARLGVRDGRVMRVSHPKMHFLSQPNLIWSMVGAASIASPIHSGP